MYAAHEKLTAFAILVEFIFIHLTESNELQIIYAKYSEE